MRKTVLLLILLVFLASCAPQKIIVEEGSQAAVSIVNFAFNPEIIKLKQGSTVVWENKDASPHTVTSDSFDSGRLNHGSKWSKTFDKKGSFQYHCSYHPGMEGTIIVE